MFNHRSNEEELLDSLVLDGNAMKKNLDEMEMLNRWFGSKSIIKKLMKKISKKYSYTLKNQKIVIADLGCGSGDLLRTIDDWAQKHKLDIELIGIDINPSIVSYAVEKSGLHPAIQYKTMDILSTEFIDNRYDIIFINSLCHHFNNITLIQLFKQLEKQARLAVVINDLQRHCLSYFSIKWLSILLNFSYLAKNDGPASVLRAFRKHELVTLLKQAGIGNYLIHWAWAFRWKIIIWCKNKDGL